MTKTSQCTVERLCVNEKIQNNIVFVYLQKKKKKKPGGVKNINYY